MIEKIGENVFAIYPPAEGSNSYLLVGKENILIDSSSGANRDYLKNSLGDIGIKPREIGAIIHTHGHADHFGGDNLFPRARKRMHEFDAKKVNMKDPHFTCAGFFEGTVFPTIKEKDFLSEGLVIENEPFSLAVIETPGHTKGSVCIYDKKNKLLFSGDCIFNEGVGRYDLQSSSMKDTISSLRKLLKLNYAMLLPGHGNILDGKEKQKENVKMAIRMVE